MGARALEFEGEENHVNVEEIVVFSIGGDGLGSVEAPCSSNNYMALFSIGGDGLETYTVEAPCSSNSYKAGQLWLEREAPVKNIELTVVGVCFRFSSHVLTSQDISSLSSYVVTFQTMKSLLKRKSRYNVSKVDFRAMIGSFSELCRTFRKYNLALRIEHRCILLVCIILWNIFYIDTYYGRRQEKGQTK